MTDFRTSSYCAAIFFAASAMPALAYIDPITGSIIVQSIIGGLAAAAVAIRSVREKIIAFFRPAKNDEKAGPNDA